LKTEIRWHSEMSATRTIVTILGILVGVSGAIHGFFEVLQGYRSTDGFFIFAIGKGNSWTMWTQGSEGAFTLVQNFLVTGILAIIVGGVLAVWSAFYIKTKRGSLIFLLIGICLFLVGGGVAQVPFIVLTAAVITRIDKPLNWWRKNLPKNLRFTLAKLPFWLFAGFLVLFSIAFEVSIFGFFPQITEPSVLLTISWSALGFATVLLLASIVGAFAHDIEHNENALLEQKN
jgi:hypothetical protein